MGQTKHTPGPWFVDAEFSRNISAEGNRQLAIVTRRGSEPFKEYMEEREANAHLIAAAPDLKEAASDGLYALKHVLDCIEEGEDFRVDGLEAAHAALKAALAKAEATR